MSACRAPIWVRRFLGLNHNHLINDCYPVGRTKVANDVANLVESRPLIWIVWRRRRLEKEASIVDEVAVRGISRRRCSQLIEERALGIGSGGSSAAPMAVEPVERGFVCRSQQRSRVPMPNPDARFECKSQLRSQRETTRELDRFDSVEMPC